MKTIKSFISGFRFDRLRDLIYGYDIFISYDFDQGKTYAPALRKGLEAPGNSVRCFLDREGFRIGDELKAMGRRRLQMSEHLLVLLTPGVGEKDSWVPHELMLFTGAGTKNMDRIIPINVAGCFDLLPADAHIRQYLPVTKGPDGGPSILYHPITAEEFASGPSADTISRITGSIGTRRTDHRRIGFFRAASAVMLALSITAGIMALIAENGREELAGALSTAAFGSAAASLERGDVAGAVPGAVATLAAAIDADDSNASAADRLYTVLVQRLTPWLRVDAVKPKHMIRSSALDRGGRLFAVALEGGAISIGRWPEEPVELAERDCGVEAGSSATVRLAFAPDSKTLMALHSLGDFCLWDSASRQPIRHDWFESPKAHAFSIDSRFVAIGLQDGSVGLVPVAGGELRWMRSSHEAVQPGDDEPDLTVSRMRFIDDGKRLVVMRADRTLVWDIERGETETLLLNRLSSEDEDQDEAISRISPDGRWYSKLVADHGVSPMQQVSIAPISREPTDDDKKAWQYNDRTIGNAQVAGSAFDSTSSLFAVSFDDGSVRVLRRGRSALKLTHFGAYRVGFDETGKIVYSISFRDIRFWSTETGLAVLPPLSVDGSRLTVALAFESGLWTVMVIDDGAIALWSASQGIGLSATPKDQGQREVLPRAQRSDDGRRTLLRISEGLWNVKGIARPIEYRLSGQAEADLINEKPDKRQVLITTAAAISGDGKTVVTIAGELPPAVWTVGDDRPRLELKRKDLGRYATQVFLDRLGDRAVVVYSSDRGFRVPASYVTFDLRSGRELSVGNLDFGDRVQDFARNGSVIAFARDRTITIREATNTQRIIGAPTRENGVVCDVLFSDDDKAFVTMTTAGSLVLREARSGMPLSEPLMFQPRRVAQDEACPKSLWFSDRGRLVNLSIYDRKKAKTDTLSWQVRPELSPRQRRRLAEFARRYYAVRLGANGAVESTLLATPAELCRALAAIESRDLMERIGPILRSIAGREQFRCG